MDYTQADHIFIAHAHYEHGTNFVVVGTPDDVRTYLSGTVHIDHAPIEDAIANVDPITYEIQVNHDNAGGNEYWRTIGVLAASTLASTMETLDDAAAAAQKVVPVAATGDILHGDLVYIMDDDGAPGSEWAQIADIEVGVSFTVIDNLTNPFTSGEDVFVKGVAHWVFHIPNLSGIAWLRVICRNGSAVGHNWASAAYAKYATDIAD